MIGKLKGIVDSVDTDSASAASAVATTPGSSRPTIMATCRLSA